jgi:translation initiation factor IF-3
VTEDQEIKRRLAAIGKNRQWLAKQLKMSEHTIRQYLQPRGKRTREFLEEIERVIVLEEARQRENRADSPPWNVLFKTAEEFDRVDRASRVVDAESVTEFCREVLLKRAEEILEEKARSRYPAGKARGLPDEPKREEQ